MPIAVASHTLRRILIIDEDPSARHSLTMLLARDGYEVASVGDVTSALKELGSRPYDVAFAPAASASAMCEDLRRHSVATHVIAVCAPADLEVGLAALGSGALAYVTRPYRPEEVVHVLKRADERERLLREVQGLRRQIAQSPVGPAQFADMIGKSLRMQEIFRTIRKLAEYKTTVLITGESGTGKELVARALHHYSPRGDGTFVAINCGAIPETLLESELFGHRKGAFTDASRDKKGLFEEASGGTLFLDEVGELPLQLQVKLLRALQEEEIRPLGATQDIKVDVRVVAATVRDLQQEVAAGRFREDLFYRLNVLGVHLPPLRDRREDIPALVEHFLQRLQAKMGARAEGITAEALKLIVDYAWPGNVRELENTIERAVVLADGPRIDVDSLPEKVRHKTVPPRSGVTAAEYSIKKTVRAVEEELIRKALRKTGGNRTKAAEILEISHRTLLYKIKEFGIDDR
ncbi:MAG TPA: sigma-54 dependent transcriptional regulator [Polyangia bacterium]|nr:sigma-54 dependent transcriptional regulator [Polyangia bacterium]